MAVIVTDNRIIVNEADAITGWIGSPTLFTADPSPVEATGAIGYVVSTATVDSYVTVGATNLSNALVYVWVFPRGAMDTTAAGGISIHLGDGTNRIAFHLAGSDVAAFTHLSGPVGWYCVALDTTNLPTTFTVRAGSLANLNLSAITQIGAVFKTLAKSVGGVSNCFVDIIRYGLPANNNGAMLSISGGTSADPGKFSEIAETDRLTTNQRAHGIIHELGAGLFGVQGSLRFGDAVGTSSSWFEDKNVSVAFEARGFSTTRYRIAIRDNGVGTTTFKLGDKTGTGTAALGTNGCNIIVPPGVGGEFDSQTDTNVDNVFLYGSNFSGFTNGFRMRTGQEFIGNKLSQSGTFFPGGALVYNSEISGSTATAAVEVTSIAHMSNIANSSFNGNNRAIRLTTAGTYTFDGLEFSGNTNDIENASTGLITINATNGTNVATFINTNGGSTVIVNAKTFVITNIIEGSEVRILRTSDGVELGGVETVGAIPESPVNVDVSADPDNAGRFRVSYTYGYSGDVAISVIVFNVEFLPIFQASVLRANDSSLPVNQIADRQYDRGTTFSPT
jgi:hypothetical protein